MKKTVIYYCFLCFAFNIISSQETLKQNNYQRSSLHLTLVSLQKDFGDKIARTLDAMPFPDKYNNHNFKIKNVNFTSLFDNLVNFNSLIDDVDNDEFNYRKMFDNYIDEQKLANKLVAKWFNRKRDGSFNMQLVAERGFYNASELEALLADKTIRGRAALADSGEELIQNTFVLLGMIYVGTVRKSAFKYRFIIASEVHLYQLNWNDDLANSFYNDLWLGKDDFDLKRKKAFNSSNLFTLTHIGSQKSTDIIKQKPGEAITESPGRRIGPQNYELKIYDKEQFETLITRHFDNVYANLQKKYPVFRVMQPLATTSPLTAKIGKKEGLIGGEKFEVLEQVLNEKTGKTTFKRKGIIKVDAKNIWDNRYNIGEEGTENKNGSTHFKGNGNFYPGMLIRQID